MRAQRILIILSIFLGLFMVSSGIRILESQYAQDFIPFRWNLVEVIDADKLGTGNEDVTPTYTNVLTKIIAENFPKTALVLEKRFGIIFQQPVSSFGPFAPIAFDPALVVCPVSGASSAGGPFTGTHNDCLACGSCTTAGGWWSENGTDWSAPTLTPVLAVVSGTISGGGGCSGSFGPAGTYNEQRFYLCGDDGNAYYYTHLDPNNIPISAGQRVTQGQIIAYIASTGGGAGPHLHFAIAASFSCSHSSPPFDDPALITYDEWFECCTSGGGDLCQLIEPCDPATDPLCIPPPGGGQPGLPRPLPEPFTCEPADPMTCVDPALSQNDPGYNQERCLPADPECSQGFCWGLCTDDDGNVFTNLGSLEDVALSSDPLGQIISLDPGGGLYCGYAVSDRCGDLEQGGGCSFVLECETHAVCDTSQACVEKPGRSLTAEEIAEGLVSCDSDADCRATHNVCLADQCVAIAGPGEHECGSASDCPVLDCITEDITITNPNGTTTTQEVCIRPAVRNACIDASTFQRQPNDADDDFFTQIDPRGIPAGPQCAEIACWDGNLDGIIDAGECSDACSDDAQCGLTIIEPLDEIEEAVDPEDPVCGDGICDAGEDASCPVDCILRQDPLPPFPHGSGEGEVAPIFACSDTDANGIFDSCIEDGESTILCDIDEDCTRAFHSSCQGDSCIIVDGPGSNQCGEPATATDTAALDPDLCSFDCSALEAGLPGGCSIGTGFCAPEYQSQFFPSDEACVASVTCHGESRGNPFALNDSCLSGGTADYSVGLFQINLLVWCNSAFSQTGTNCVIGSQAVLDQCMASWGYGDPILNSSRAAADIWSTSNGWCHWSAAKSCGVATTQAGGACP